MALNSTDLFLVQQGADLKKCTLEQIEEYISAEIAAGDTIHFRGNVNLTQPYNNGGQLQINPPLNGDMYINEGTGAIDVQVDGWIMANGETQCEAGDRVIYDAGDDEWILVKGDSGAGVESIQVNNGLELDSGSTATDVIINGVDAGVGTVGVVELAECLTGGEFSPVAEKVLHECHFNELASRISTAAGGGVQTVDGELPIYVEAENSGHDVTVKIKDASTADKGAVQLTSGPYALRTDETLAVTPKGVFDDYVPRNWSTIPLVQ